MERNRRHGERLTIVVGVAVAAIITAMIVWLFEYLAGDGSPKRMDLNDTEHVGEVHILDNGR